MKTQPTRTDSTGPEAGFTLVETLVAILILVVGLMAVTNLLVVGATSNSAASHGTAATAVASRVLDTLKGYTWGDPSLTLGGSLTADQQNAGGVDCFRTDTVPGVGVIRSRWTIQSADPTGRVIFITVRSESAAPLMGARSRAEFTTFRSCTAQALGCP